MLGGVTELDLHGMNTYQAQIAIDAALRRCGGGVYRLRAANSARLLNTICIKENKLCALY